MHGKKKVEKCREIAKNKLNLQTRRHDKVKDNYHSVKELSN